MGEIARRTKSLRRKIRIIANYIVVAFAIFFALFPIYWMVITSFKDEASVYSGAPRFLPFIDYEPVLLAWNNVFGWQKTEMYMAIGELGLFMRNSLIAATGSSILTLIIGSTAAYALARFQFKKWKNRDIEFFILSQRMFPPIAAVIPFFILFKTVGLLDNVVSLILIYGAMNLPLAVWLLKDFFTKIPIELEESAMIDGCSRLQLFRRVVLPLVLPGLAVTAVICFIFAWNEFLFALALTFKNAKTLPMQMAGYITLRGPRYWDLAAVGLITMTPPLILTMIAYRYIIRGLTFGAVKG